MHPASGELAIKLKPTPKGFGLHASLKRGALPGFGYAGTLAGRGSASGQRRLGARERGGGRSGMGGDADGAASGREGPADPEEERRRRFEGKEG